jgi:hypothetical protein
MIFVMGREQYLRKEKNHALANITLSLPMNCFSTSSNFKTYGRTQLLLPHSAHPVQMEADLHQSPVMNQQTTVSKRIRQRL